VLTKELRAPEHTGAFDVVVCTEVLEHCTSDTVDEVVSELRRLVSPRGIAIVSVPIEIGPSLLVKQLVRAIAGWRRLGDYQYSERYRASELLHMAFGGRSAEIPREAYRTSFSANQQHEFHGHKGFNWHRLQRRIESGGFTIRETRFSPIEPFRGFLNSQVWFVCAPA
jgi:2-polyprenyl-3-methyl-5-hydroxy-6-metoxy-1,4-benzoquinol methylase